MAAIYYQDIGFAELFLFEKYVISQLKEGTVLEPRNNPTMIKALTDHYQEKPFVYISNRTYAYNVSPMIYREASTVETLKAICIVTPKAISQQTATFEGKFYRNEFHVCGTLDEGIKWAQKFLERACRS